MADFRAKRVSVLEGLLLLTHATGLAARGAGEVAGLRRPQCRPRHGRGQTDPRFTWGERPRGAGAARRGWRSRGRLPRLRGSLCSPRSRTEEHGPGDGAGTASPPGGAGTAGCLRAKSEPRHGPRGLHQVSADGPGPRREPPTRRRPAGCAEVGRRQGVQTAADAPGAPPSEGSGGRAGRTRAERFCCSNARFERMRRRATGRGKIFAKDTSNKYTKNSQSSAVRTATIHFKDGPEPPAGASHAGGVGRVNTLSRTPRDQTGRRRHAPVGGAARSTRRQQDAALPVGAPDGAATLETAWRFLAGHTRRRPPRPSYPLEFTQRTSTRKPALDVHSRPHPEVAKSPCGR